MSDVIEIKIVRLPVRRTSWHAELLAIVRLTPREGGGCSTYVRSGVDETFWQSRGFPADELLQWCRSWVGRAA